MDTATLATAEGTSSFRDRFRGEVVPDWFRSAVGRWTVSNLGVGTLLGELDSYTDDVIADAVTQCLELGCNLVDTAVHYRHQRSERSVGRALEGLFAGGKLRRSEVVVSTKGGTIPFDTFRAANPSRDLLDRYVLPGLLPEEEVVEGRHCIHPDYLEHELEQSLRNLGLAGVDVYYLHQLEIQLGSVSHAEFQRRIRAAFERLEQKVAEGKVGMYGVATWSGLRTPDDAPGHLSLAELEALARDVGGDGHHFRAVQLPLSLIMPEAGMLGTQLVGGHRVSLLAAAEALGLAVFACGALAQGHLVEGLPIEVRETVEGLTSDAQRALQSVRSVPGVTAVLVGMKRREHIEENLSLRSRPLESWAQVSRLFS